MYNQENSLYSGPNTQPQVTVQPMQNKIYNDNQRVKFTPAYISTADGIIRLLLIVRVLIDICILYSNILFMSIDFSIRWSNFSCMCNQHLCTYSGRLQWHEGRILRFFDRWFYNFTCNFHFKYIKCISNWCCQKSALEFNCKSFHFYSRNFCFYS